MGCEKQVNPQGRSRVVHRGLRRVAAPEGTNDRLRAMVGEEVVAFVTAAKTVSGRVHAIFPPGQNPCVTADIAADVADHLRAEDDV